jgi:predicted amidohydrolase
MILGPKGEILFEGGEGEEAGFVTIDLDEVTKTRDFLTVFNDRVPEIYGTHLR